MRIGFQNGLRPLFLTGLFILAALLLGNVPAGADTGRSGESGTIELQGGDTLFLAGRDLTIDRKVAGSLTVTGETVTVTRQSAVKGDVWIAARRVAVEGDVGGDLSIRAQDALINGHVKGSVSFYGVHLGFGPDARVDGGVNYYAASPAEVDKGARIAGAMRPNVLDEAPYDGRWYERHMRDRWHEGWSAPGYRLSFPGAVFFGFIAAVVALAMPATAERLRAAVAAQPALIFLVGLVWLIGTPVLAAIAAVTIIGLPLAFVVILLWPLGLLAGLVASIVALGEMLSGRITLGEPGALRRILGVAVATVILWIGISLPAFGGIVWLVAVTGGVGAIALSARERIV